MLRLLALCVSLAVLGSVSAQTYNYNEVLRKSILFYEAQRSGRLPSNNRIPWRGDSALNDRGLSNEDLSGGWYDAGDYVKFGFPMAMATTALLWGGIEFQSAYSSASELNNLRDSLRWPLDYFMKAHVNTNQFYGQVGHGETDHNYWGRPEQMTMNRPSYRITTTAGGSDLAGETAAALAAGYLFFRDSDSTYAFRLLDHARRLYDFAYNTRAVYSNSISDARQYYASSGYNDELAWGAAWLHKATGESVYLTRALQFASTTDVAWAYDWDSKTVAYQLLLFTSGQNQFSNVVQNYLRAWFPGGTVPYTPKGLAWRLEWGSNRYAANSALIAIIAAKYNLLRAQSIDFARRQIHYMLGDHGRSLVVGFGTNPPQRPHHASSSCKDMPATCNWTDYSLSTPNPQVLNGALVGGPDRNDGYRDDRTDYVSNEVTCDYNAGFQGAVAGLKQLALTNNFEILLDV
jgi:endoglucanase